MNLPKVSVITVNFNGKDYLAGLLSSLYSLDYPADSLEIIMVDNASNDGSVEFVKNNFPEVKIVCSSKNTGFAGGNNRGALHAKGDYLAFINNDCEVDVNWLRSLADAAAKMENDQKAGSFGSKVLFFFKYIILDFILDKDLSVSIKEEKITSKNTGSGFLFKKAQDSLKFLNGSFSLSRDLEGNIIRRTKGIFRAAVPVFDLNQDIVFDFKYLASGSGNLSILLEGRELFSRSLQDKGPGLPGQKPDDLKFESASINISKEYFIFAKDIVNSAGSEINKSFYAREIGYETIDQSVLPGDDEGEAENIKEVFALPGSSFMIKRELYEECGLFDEKFFTYYEDIDFFYRARLKGWKAYCVLDSKARHFHCGSGKEWSKSFTYFVLRNRIIMIYKNAPFFVFLKNYFSFSAAAFINLAYTLAARLKGNRVQRIDIPLRFKIVFEMFVIIFTKIKSRVKNRMYSKVSDKEIKKWAAIF